MVSAVHATAAYQGKLQPRFGYITLEDGQTGMQIRGHEFHYSRVLEKPDGPSPLWELRSPAASSARAEHEGAALGCISGSYVHLSMLSHPDAARCFVARCLPRQNDLNKDMS